jgi:hypothetical protein
VNAVKAFAADHAVPLISFESGQRHALIATYRARFTGGPFAKRADDAKAGQSTESNSVTVTGKVVDAACYSYNKS